MTETLTEAQTNDVKAIYPFMKQIQTWAISKYDGVYKLSESKLGTFIQAFPDLPDVYKDAKTMKKLAARFGFKKTGVKTFMEPVFKDYVDEHLAN